MFKMQTIHTVASPLQNHYNSFMSVVRALCKPDKYYYPNQTIIEFNNLNYPTIGLCSKGFNKWVIDIDAEYYNSHPNSQFSLAYHEMTHCILGYDHSKDENNYMATTLNSDLSNEVVYAQFLTNVLNRCGDGK